MGIKIFGSSSSFGLSDLSLYETNIKPEDINPDPVNFVIDNVISTKDYLLAIVTYPNCTNFDGQKYILFKGLSELELFEMDTLDPHFFPENKIVARLKPNEEGLELAYKIMEI